MRGQMTHLDTDVLAEFRAGLIAGRRGARISAHLAGCDRCTALDGQLAGVSVLLASVPAPALPDSVAQRLDTVLAAEVAQRDNPERARGDGAGEAAEPGRPAGHRGFPLWTWRVLVPAGAAVVLAAGGFGLSQIGQSTSSQSAASSAGGAQATAAARPSASRVNGPATAPIQGAAPRPLRMTPANFVVTTSSTEFARAAFRQQVESDLRAAAASPASPATHAPLAPLRACVRKIAGDDTLQLVETARFEGGPATLIVARTGSDDTAWLAGPDCSATNRDVLATTSVPAGISEP